MAPDPDRSRLCRELDKLGKIYQRTKRDCFFYWDKAGETVTIFPPKIAYLFAYGLGFLSVSGALALSGLMLVELPNLTDENAAVIFAIVLPPVLGLFGLGVYAFAAAERIGFTMLDLRHKIIFLEKIGVFAERDIAGIVICANPWNERFRSHFEDILRNEKTLLADESFVKNVTVSVRFNKRLFLGFKTKPIAIFRHYQDAKTFQYALAKFYNCQQIELNRS